MFAGFRATSANFHHIVPAAHFSKTPAVLFNYVAHL